MSPKARRIIAALVPWLLLVAAFALVAVQLKRPGAIWQMWRPWAETGAIAAVMTAVMLTGGIDLSVGSIVALCGMTLGLLWQDLGWPIAAAAGAAVGVGLLAGAVNGTMIIAGIPPLVATLATKALYAGLAMAISSGRRISGLPDAFCRLGQGWWLGLPSQIWLLAMMMLCAYAIVHRTRLGRYLYAVGDNRVAAQFAAVNVNRLEWSLYTASGLVAGLVALAYTARGGAAIPQAASGLELEVIACVVLGGTRVTGGAGGIGRTLLGLAVMSQLDLGLQLLGTRRIELPWDLGVWQLNAYGRLVIVGALVVAIAVWNEWATAREAD